MIQLSIIKADIKNIFRDRSLVFIVFVPIIFLILLRLTPPVYEPYAAILKEYRSHILAFFCVLTSGLYGFILSFIMLDEKDQGIIPLLKVLPVPAGRLMYMRSALIFAFSLLSNCILVFFSGMATYSFAEGFLLSFTSSFAGPISAFLITSLANNKIEGLTYFKLFNLVLLAPIAGLFIQSKLSLLVGIIPFYWVYAGFTESSVLSLNYLILIGLLYNLFILWGVVKLYVKRLN